MANRPCRDREKIGSLGPCRIFYIFADFCWGWVVWTFPELYSTHPWKFCEHRGGCNYSTYGSVPPASEGLIVLPDDSASALAAAADPTSSIWLLPRVSTPSLIADSPFPWPLCGGLLALDSATFQASTLEQMGTPWSNLFHAGPGDSPGNSLLLLPRPNHAMLLN